MGHLRSAAYKRLKPGNLAYEVLVELVKKHGNPIQYIIEHFTGPLSPPAEVQLLERGSLQMDGYR